ncbi:MAG: DUF5683 domain-containing protein [Flavobacteriaceae bacterium]
MNHKFIFSILFFLVLVVTQAQETKEEEEPQRELNSIVIPDSLKYSKDYSPRIKRLIDDPLTPSKAAFYSAIIPGLGQAYVGKAWKVPVIYGLLGLAVYSFDLQNDQMTSYRTAYKRRKNGFFDDQYLEKDIPISTEQLLLGMEFHKKYRDMAIILGAAAYMLNILDANVSAHLLQFNVSDDLSVSPNLIINNEQTGIRLAVSFD